VITLSRARCSCVSIRYDCRSPPRAGTKHRQKGNRVERQIVHLLRSHGITLILGVDRILDMCRTAANVTGDAAVATSVASMEDQLNLELEEPAI